MRFEQNNSTRKSWWWLLIIVGLGSLMPVYSSSLLEVGVRGNEDLRLLLAAGLDVTYVSHGHLADVVIHNDRERQRLDETGLQYFVTHPELEQFLARRMAEGQRDDMGGYYTLDELEAEINDLHEEFPDIVSEPISIGESIEGRNIWAVLISDNPEDEEDEPEVLLTSLLHAREAITPQLTTAVMRLLAEGYGQDDYLTHLVDERQTWFIPCVNPDGYRYNEELEPDGGGMWRKNKRENPDGSIGVDLNRNFAYEWGYDNEGSDPRPDDNCYRGPEPFSEPETQALREFINEHHFTISMFFHSYGNLCLYTYSYDFVHAPHRAAFRALSEEFIRENQYEPGTGWEILYLTNGDSDDWIYGSEEHDPIMAFTTEIGTRRDYFWPPLDRIQPLIDENIDCCLKVIEYGDNPARALPSLPPRQLQFWVDNNGFPRFTWQPPDDDDNPPLFYQLLTVQPDEPFVDEIDLNSPDWELFGVTVTGFEPHSAPRCYRLNPRDPQVTLTRTREFIAPDRISAWLKLTLTRENNLTFEVSEDGYEWIPAPGRNTENIIAGNYNHGPGLRRITVEDWQEFWWDLSEWEGRPIRVRFRYYEFGRYGQSDRIYIDDIGPFPGAEWTEIAEDLIEEPQFADLEDRHENDFQYYVRAIDRENDTSFWSQPAIEIGGRQVFSLVIERGWSMISAPVAPENPQLEVMFGELVEQDLLRLLKDGDGLFYTPDFNFNQIGAWNPLQGYWIKVDEAFDLDISGDRVWVNTPIPVERGWNLVSYLPLDPLPADLACQSLGENLRFIKDDQGRFWTIEHNFSNLEDLQRGEGYLVKVLNDDELVYPEGEPRVAATALPLRAEPELFAPLSDRNHSLLLELDPMLTTGMISAFDPEHHLVGQVDLSATASGMVGLAVWGQADERSPGSSENDAFNLSWQPETGAEVPLVYDLKAGDQAWQNHGFSVLTVKPAQAALPTRTGLTSAYPNPFNSRVRLQFSLPQAGEIEIGIYDASGKQVKNLTAGFWPAGAQALVWEAEDVPTGIYFARIRSIHQAPRSVDLENTILKLLLIR